MEPQGPVGQFWKIFCEWVVSEGKEREWSRKHIWRSFTVDKIGFSNKGDVKQGEGFSLGSRVVLFPFFLFEMKDIWTYLNADGLEPVERKIQKWSSQSTKKMVHRQQDWWCFEKKTKIKIRKQPSWPSIGAPKYLSIYFTIFLWIYLHSKIYWNFQVKGKH